MKNQSIFTMVGLMLWMTGSLMAQSYGVIPKERVPKKETEKTEDVNEKLESLKKKIEDAMKQREQKVRDLVMGVEKVEEPKDTFEFFFGIESPQMGAHIDEIREFKNLYSGVDVKIYFLYSAFQLQKLMMIGQQDGQKLIDHFPQTVKFLSVTEKMNISFPVLVENEALLKCHTLGSVVPLTVFTPKDSKDDYYWHGVPPLKKAYDKLSSLR